MLRGVLDMFPGYAPMQVRYMTLADSIQRGNVSLPFAACAPFADFYDLLFSKLRRRAIFTLLALLVRSLGLPALGNHVTNVIKVCAKKQVSGIAAKFIVAMVQDVHPFGNGAVGEFPCNAVGSCCLPVDGKLPVSVATCSGSPVPAIGITEFVHSLPKAICDRLAVVMPTDKSRLMTSGFSLFQRLTAATCAKLRCWWSQMVFVVPKHIKNRISLEPATGAVGKMRDLSFLPTTAHAQSAGIGWFNFFLSMLMPKNKAQRFAFYPFSPRIVIGCKICFLSASAMAVSIRDFIRGLSRGMIIHVDTFLSRFGHSVGRLHRRHGLFIGSYFCKYTTNAQFPQLATVWRFA